MGTQRGLNRIKDVPFTSSRPATACPTTRSTPSLRSRDDSIWVRTDGGGLDRIRTAASRVFTVRPTAWASDYIGPLFEARDGAVWAGGDGYVSRIAAGR